MSQVTADLTKLKENDKNEELGTKLSQLGTGIYSISTFLSIQIRLSTFILDDVFFFSICDLVDFPVLGSRNTVFRKGCTLSPTSRA